MMQIFEKRIIKQRKIATRIQRGERAKKTNKKKRETLNIQTRDKWIEHKLRYANPKVLSHKKLVGH